MRCTPLKSGPSLKRTAFARSERKEINSAARLRNVKPNPHQRTTAAEHAHLAAVAALGCILITTHPAYFAMQHIRPARDHDNVTEPGRGCLRVRGAQEPSNDVETLRERAGEESSSH